MDQYGAVCSQQPASLPPALPVQTSLSSGCSQHLLLAFVPSWYPWSLPRCSQYKPVWTRMFPVATPSSSQSIPGLLPPSFSAARASQYRPVCSQCSFTSSQFIPVPHIAPQHPPDSSQYIPVHPSLLPVVPSLSLVVPSPSQSLPVVPSPSQCPPAGEPGAGDPFCPGARRGCCGDGGGPGGSGPAWPRPGRRPGHRPPRGRPPEPPQDPPHSPPEPPGARGGGGRGGEQRGRGGGHGVWDTPAPLGRLDRGAAAAAAMMGGGVSGVSPPSLGDTPPPPCSPNWGGIKAPPPMGVWEEESCDYWRERPLREPLAPLRAPLRPQRSLPV